jgi:hypothetical protein
MFTTKDLISTSQVKFFALDSTKTESDYVNNGELASLALLDISEAEKHNTIAHCVSVYSLENDRLEAGAFKSRATCSEFCRHIEI